jgi:flagellar assembly factor FliW
MKDERGHLIYILKRMDEFSRSIKEDNLKAKVEHPILGFLNAKEWFLLTIYHYNTREDLKEDLERAISKGW